MKKEYSKPDIVVGKSENLIVRCKRAACSGSSTHAWGNFTKKEEIVELKESKVISA